MPDVFDRDTVIPEAPAPTTRAWIVRRDDRADSLARVELVDPPVDGCVINLSPSGACIGVWARVETGRVLTVCLIEGDRQAIRHGRVRWTRAHPDGTIVGIEFGR